MGLAPLVFFLAPLLVVRNLRVIDAGQNLGDARTCPALAATLQVVTPKCKDGQRSNVKTSW